MNHVLIRIPLTVDDFHALAGYYTAGPSMAAIYGFVSHLEREASQDFAVNFEKFGFLLDTYTARLGEQVKTSYDVLPKAKQAGDTVISGYRYASLTGSLYILMPADGFTTEDINNVLDLLARAVNRARFQGGHIRNMLTANPADKQSITFTPVTSPDDVVARLLNTTDNAVERKSAKLYLSKHLPDACDKDTLLDAFAEHLAEYKYVLVCNGYVEVGEVFDSAGQPHAVAEPCFTLAELMPLSALPQLTYSEQAEVISRFFWTFDEELRAKDPRYLTLK